MRWIKCQNCGKIVQADGEKVFCPECRAELKANSTLAERTCRGCERTFVGGPRAWYCHECRAERKKETDRRHRKNGTQRKLGSVDHCEICGKEYIVEGGLQRYCKNCAEDAVREIDRAQGREWNKKNKDRMLAQKKERKENRKACAVCRKQFYTGGPEVTCSEECAKVWKSYNMAMTDFKRARREKEPTIEEFASYHARQSGVKGVSRSRNGKRWVAHVGGRHLGTFDTIEEAEEAVKEARSGLDQSNA